MEQATRQARGELAAELRRLEAATRRERETRQQRESQAIRVARGRPRRCGRKRD